MKKIIFISFLLFLSFVLIGVISAESNCIEEGKTFDSSQDPDAKCCEGLQEKSQYDLRTCIALPSLKYTCVRCGNGECGLGENKCNCPLDCDTIIVGNDSDEHGCVGSAGYFWCEEKQKCIRPWEETCNAKTEKVKIIPEAASQKAIEKLGNLGFNVQLKEVGKDENAKYIYAVEGLKDVKILGLFLVKMKVTAEVDTETGEIIKIHKPWWSFLAW